MNDFQKLISYLHPIESNTEINNIAPNTDVSFSHELGNRPSVAGTNFLKECRICKEKKQSYFFYKHSTSKDGLRTECKKCFNEKPSKNKSINAKQYYQKNKEIIKNKAKEYYSLNKDKVAVASKRKAEKYKTRRNNILCERYKKEPLYKLSLTIRNMLVKSIKNNGFSKNSKSEKIIGCSFFELKKHIETQFLEGMDWSNHGEWHIDHKTPISWAKTEDETIKLNHYTNLQPLWRFDNLSKKNYYAS